MYLTLILRDIPFSVSMLTKYLYKQYCNLNSEKPSVMDLLNIHYYYYYYYYLG